MRFSAIVLVVLAGCSTLNQQAIDAAPSKSTYMLCSNLVNATMASPELREAWAQELQRRGENCGQHMAVIEAEQRGRAQNNAAALQMLQQSRGQPMAPPQGFSNLIYQSASGTTRYCVYDKAGQKVTVAQPQLAPCPANL